MLDLGTSLLASVERDPDAVAIVDGSVRLSYAQWYRRISAVVAGFDELNLRTGDHVLTALQNRWEAATIHWACQFAGIICTPINWRSKASEIDYYVEDSLAKAVVFEDACTSEIRQSRAAASRPCIGLEGLQGNEVSFRAMVSRDTPGALPRASAEAWSRDALHLRHDGASRKACPAANARNEPPRSHMWRKINMATASARSACMPLYHTMGVRSLLAMSLIGGAFVCLPRFEIARALDSDRSRTRHQPLSGADALSRSCSSSAFCRNRRQFGA